MQHRLLVTAAAVVALAAPLSSCGFDYATDRDYTPGSGANDREGEVDVLSAVVVSAAEGSGTFVASFSNNTPDEEQTFTAVPVSRSHPVISRSLVDKNDYPREALLEAVLRFIEEDLNDGQHR